MRVDYEVFVKCVDRHRFDLDKNNKLVVNIFGGPNCGKKTAAMALTARLRQEGFRADYLADVAEEYRYHKTESIFDGTVLNQTRLLTEQIKKYKMLYNSDKVDIIVVDSPFFMRGFYVDENVEERDRIIKSAKKMTFKAFTCNFFINRETPSDPHSFIDERILNELEKYSVDLAEVGADEIENMVMCVKNEVRLVLR